jgi:hypothetical protein
MQVNRLAKTSSCLPAKILIAKAGSCGRTRAVRKTTKIVSLSTGIRLLQSEGRFYFCHGASLWIRSAKQLG